MAQCIPCCFFCSPIGISSSAVRAASRLNVLGGCHKSVDTLHAKVSVTVNRNTLVCKYNLTLLYITETKISCLLSVIARFRRINFVPKQEESWWLFLSQPSHAQSSSLELLITVLETGDQ